MTGVRIKQVVLMPPQVRSGSLLRGSVQAVLMPPQVRSGSLLRGRVQGVLKATRLSPAWCLWSLVYGWIPEYTGITQAYTGIIQQPYQTPAPNKATQVANCGTLASLPGAIPRGQQEGRAWQQEQGLLQGFLKPLRNINSSRTNSRLVVVSSSSFTCSFHLYSFHHPLSREFLMPVVSIVTSAQATTVEKKQQLVAALAQLISGEVNVSCPNQSIHQSLGRPPPPITVCISSQLHTHTSVIGTHRTLTPHLHTHIRTHHTPHGPPHPNTLSLPQTPALHVHVHISDGQFFSFGGDCTTPAAYVSCTALCHSLSRVASAGALTAPAHPLPRPLIPAGHALFQIYPLIHLPT